MNTNPTKVLKSLKSSLPLLVAGLGVLTVALSNAGFAQTGTAPSAPPSGMPVARPTQKVPVHADPKLVPKRTDAGTMSESQRAALEKSGALTMTDAKNGVLHFYHPNHGPKSPKQLQMQTYLRTRTSSGSSGSSSGQGPDLSYYGGPVLYRPIIIPVFWGFNAVNDVPSAAKDPNGAVPVIMNFLDYMVQSAWLAAVNQYYQGANQYINSGSTIVTQPIFDDSTSPGASYGKGDVYNEVAGLVQQGRVSQNTMDIIVVFTPHGSVNQDLMSGGDCAYHDSSQGVSFGFLSITVNHNYALANVPYLADSVWDCWTSGVGAITKAAGHEIAEAITDSYGDYAWNGVNFASWIVNPFQSSDPGWEIGDLCNSVTEQTTFFAGQTFTTQPLWSNQANQCVAPNGAIPLFANVSFQTANGHFITAANGGGLGEGGSSLQTDRTIPLSWETFLLLEDLSVFPPRVTLLTESGDYVTANNGGGIGGPNSVASPMHTDATAVGAWEKFNIYPTTCASPQQGNAQIQWMLANIFLHPAECVYIATSSGDFVTALNGGGYGGGPSDPFRTNAASAQSWETFVMASH